MKSKFQNELMLALLEIPWLLFFHFNIKQHAIEWSCVLSRVEPFLHYTFTREIEAHFVRVLFGRQTALLSRNHKKRIWVIPRRRRHCIEIFLWKFKQLQNNDFLAV
jgi:hypothetical protein